MARSNGDGSHIHHPVAVAKRLRATREALGLTQAEFCRRCAISPSAYSNWETMQSHRPDLESALHLKAAFRLTLDWIYCGDPSGLPRTLIAKLVKLRRRSPAVPPGSRGV